MIDWPAAITALNDGGLPASGVLTAAGRDATWMQMQGELTSLSTAGRHITAGHGGHYLQRDNPDLVSAAIRDIADRTREASRADGEPG